MAMEGISLSKREAEESSGFEEDAKRKRISGDLSPKMNFRDLRLPPPGWKGLAAYTGPWGPKYDPLSPPYNPCPPVRQSVCYRNLDKNLPPQERYIYASLKKAKSEIDRALKEMEKEKGVVVKSCTSKHDFMFREDGNFLLDLSAHLVRLRKGDMVDLNNFVWCEGPYIGKFHWSRCARWFHINFNAKFQSDHHDDSTTFEQFYFAEMIEFRCQKNPRKYMVISCVPLDRNVNVPGENSPYKCVICDCNQVHHPSSDFCIADDASMDPKDFEEWIQAGMEVKKI